MYINDEINGDTVVLHLGGTMMGGPDVDLFHGRLFRYLDSDRKKVILNLEKIERISSFGLGLLVGAIHSINKRGGEMIVANIPESIESLLILTKLITVFNAKDSIDEALASFDA